MITAVAVTSTPTFEKTMLVATRSSRSALARVFSPVRRPPCSASAGTGPVTPLKDLAGGTAPNWWSDLAADSRYGQLATNRANNGLARFNAFGGLTSEIPAVTNPIALVF